MTHVRMATKAKCIAGNQKSLLRLPINIENEADLLCNLTKGLTMADSHCKRML